MPLRGELTENTIKTSLARNSEGGQKETTQVARKNRRGADPNKKKDLGRERVKDCGATGSQKKKNRRRVFCKWEALKELGGPSTPAEWIRFLRIWARKA